MNSFDVLLRNKNYGKAYANFNGKACGNIYVEDNSDIVFWEMIVDKDKYDIKLYEKDGRLNFGKRALEKEYQNCNSSFLVAVDADLDYICCGHNQHSIMLNNSPFILHTFAYGRENIIYHVNYLNKLLKKCKLSLDIEFDFGYILLLYSRAIYQPLTHFLYLFNQGIKLDVKNFYKTISFKQHEFNKIINGDLSINIDNFNNFCQRVNDQCKKYKEQIMDNDDFNNYIIHLFELGLTSDNAYWFINSHVFENDIIKPIFERIKNIYKIKEYQKCTVKDKNRTEQINNHFKKFCNINTLLRSHMEDSRLGNTLLYDKILQKYQNLEKLTT